MGGRRWQWVAACVGYAAVLAYLLFALPTVPDQGVEWLTVGLRSVGIGISDDLSGFLLNIVLFVPAGAIGMGLFPSTRPLHWAVVGFLLSSSVEIFQHFVLPDRSGQTQDVLANTAGTFLGAVLIWAVRTAVAGRYAKRQLSERQ